MDEQLARNLADRLDELGLRIGTPIDLTDLPRHHTVPATLVHEQGQAAYNVGHSPALTASSLKWVGQDDVVSGRLLLLGPRVTERSAEMFRSLGINYVDQAGNAYITFTGVHIDVRGRRPARTAPFGAPRTTRGAVNLFSAKRSQVIFVILSWPALLDGSVRELAGSAGVSLGQAQDTLELLAEYEFLDERRQLVPYKEEQLIDQWAAAYPTGLGSHSKTERFSGKFDELYSGDMTVYVSGEAAAPALLRPETAVLYTNEFPIELVRRLRWRRDEEHPSIFLRHQFWHAPYGPEQPGVYGAPWLLVYADLLTSNDSRQREAAQQLREERR